jgi:hypothetical protein
MAKKKRAPSIDEYDTDVARIRTAPGSPYHIGDGLYRLRRRYRYAILGIDLRTDLPYSKVKRKRRKSK